jgi:hypothetical protein
MGYTLHILTREGLSVYFKDLETELEEERNWLKGEEGQLAHALKTPHRPKCKLPTGKSCLLLSRFFLLKCCKFYGEGSTA